MVDPVTEVQSLILTEQFLHYLSVGVGRQVEVPWHFVNNHIALDQAAFLALESLYRVSVHFVLVNMRMVPMRFIQLLAKGYHFNLILQHSAILSWSLRHPNDT